MKKLLLTLAMLCSFGSGALLAADSCCSKKAMCSEKKACCDDMNKKSCCGKKKMKKVKAAKNNSMEADTPMKKVRKAKPKMKSMSEVVAAADQSAMQ